MITTSVTLVPILKIISSENFQTTIQCGTENPVQSAISKFKNHPSINMMSKINQNKRFSF